jgi:hypothetical protein
MSGRAWCCHLIMSEKDLIRPKQEVQSIHIHIQMESTIRKHDYQACSQVSLSQSA